MSSSNEIEMLDAILSATRHNAVVWTRESAGRYSGEGATKIIVQEICPLIAGDNETAGVQAFQIEVNRLVFTFWDGTEGCKKIREILAAGLTEFAEHESIVSKRLHKVIERLSRDGKGNVKKAGS